LLRLENEKDVTNDLTRQILAKWDILGKKQTRDGIWYAIQRGEEKFIYFGLITRYQGEFNLKTISESMGPSYYCCPVKFFDLVPCPEGNYAPAWREKVRALDERKKFRPYVGLQFELYGKHYTVNRFVLRRNIKRWMCLDEHGREYFIKSSQYKDMNPIIREEKTA